MENKNLEQNSKNNNQRDYDKEPLIVKDYNQEVINSWSLFVFIFVIIAVFFSENKSVVFPFLIFILVRLQDKSKNAEFKFTNSTILHKSPKYIKEIGIARIDKIQKTMQTFYEIHNEKFSSKFMKYATHIFLIIWFLMLCFVMVIENSFIKLLPILAVFSLGLFVPQILYHKKIDSKFVRLYDTLLINSRR